MTTKPKTVEAFQVIVAGKELARIAANAKRGDDHMLSMAKNQARNIMKRQRVFGNVLIINEASGDEHSFDVTSAYQIADQIK